MQIAYDVYFSFYATCFIFVNVCSPAWIFRARFRCKLVAQAAPVISWAHAAAEGPSVLGRFHTLPLIKRRRRQRGWNDFRAWDARRTRESCRPVSGRCGVAFLFAQVVSWWPWFTFDQHRRRRHNHVSCLARQTSRRQTAHPRCTLLLLQIFVLAGEKCAC